MIGKVGLESRGRKGGGTEVYDQSAKVGHGQAGISAGRQDS